MRGGARMKPVAKKTLLIAFICVTCWAAFTVAFQIKFMGLAWYEEVQWERTQRVLNGESGTPWQYRLLTESLVTLTVYAFDAIGIPRPIGTAFVLIRLIQNFAIFSLALVWYRRLGLTVMEGLLGIALLGWGMCHALYDGDLTFNTYTDMSIFLGSATLISMRKYYWMIPILILAPLNRETSGWLSMMVLVSAIQFTPRLGIDKRALWVGLFGLLMWTLIISGLRLVYGVQPYIVPTAGVSPILPLLIFNLTWWRTWVFMFATFGMLPLFALYHAKRWPNLLHRFFWVVVPFWFPVHFMLAHAPETRLFLVPHAVFFVPGALLGLTAWTSAGGSLGTGSGWGNKTS
jgi:hypothetical protein